MCGRPPFRSLTGGKRRVGEDSRQVVDGQTEQVRQPLGMLQCLLNPSLPKGINLHVCSTAASRGESLLRVCNDGRIACSLIARRNQSSTDLAILGDR
jgi:hypothetical protein